MGSTHTLPLQFFCMPVKLLRRQDNKLSLASYPVGTRLKIAYYLAYAVLDNFTDMKVNVHTT